MPDRAVVNGRFAFLILPSAVKDKKILFADPSIAIRRIAEIAFADTEADFIAVADGAAAMESFVASQPDVVVVDVDLPGTNGYQICELIKDEPATSLIPVVLLASSFVPIDEDAVERCHADAVVLKPFLPVKHLVDKVMELVSPAEKESIEDIGAEVYDIETGDEKNADPLDDIDHLYVESFLADHEEEPSPEILVEQTVAASEQDISDDLNPVELQFRDAVTDDELIETVLVDPPTDDELIDEVRLEPPAAEAEKDRQMREFDWSPEAIVDDSKDTEPVASGFEPKFTFSDDLVPNSSDTEQAPDAKSSYDPDLIQAVAQAVIDHLSDKVIREVAQESVPRITEQLIREALDVERSKA